MYEKRTVQAAASASARRNTGGQMSVRLKIAANTRYAFAGIGLMLTAFSVFAAVSLIPMGMGLETKILVIRAALYTVLFSAVCSGVFSLRVAWLRKKSGLS